MKKFTDSITDRMCGRYLKSMQFIGKTVKSKIVLDCGCYNGWLSNFFKKNKARLFVGLDLSKNYLKLYKKNGFDNGVVSTIIHPPFKKSSFDVIASFEVIEHLPKNSERTFIKNLNYLLKKGGRVYLSTPNKSFFSNLLDPAYFLVGHRHYSKNYLIKLFEEGGFKVEKIAYGGGFFELFSMILHYIFKVFRKEIPFKEKFERLRKKEYLNNKGFATIFIAAKKVR